MLRVFVWRVVTHVANEQRGQCFPGVNAGLIAFKDGLKRNFRIGGHSTAPRSLRNRTAGKIRGEQQNG